MRTLLLAPAALLIAAAVAPAPAAAQVSIGISVHANLGAPMRIYDYSPERDGDWRDHYRDWTPFRMYVVDGRYYPHRAPGARVVVVYEYHDRYFFPPRNRGWRGIDRRYDYREMPDDDDYGRAVAYGRHEDHDDRGHGHGHGHGRGRGHGDDGGR